MKHYAFEWFNIASVVFGLIALALPLTNLLRPNNKFRKAFVIASASACALAFYCQMIYQNYLIRIADWSALTDTSNSGVAFSGLLLIGTYTFNLLYFLVANNRAKDSGPDLN